MTEPLQSDRPALTRAGTFLLAGAFVMAVTGRVLGLLELYVLAAAGIALLIIGWLAIRWQTPRVSLERGVYPVRVHAGNASRVELSITSSQRRASPVLALVDEVSGTGGAHLLVSPIAAGATVRAAYRLPTERRGLVSIGPLSLEQTDPFGLISRTHRVGLQTDLTVLPRIVKLVPLPFSLGDDPLAGSDQPNHLGRGGEDFYALRPYVVGDDLRRVHWPSTARRGDLLVRQDEQPWQGRVTVFLDTRRISSDAVMFEEMVTAAASIITASRRRGDLVRLCTTSGLDSGFVAGHSQIDFIMEHLAVVELDSAGYWAAGIAKASSAGSLVAIVGTLNETDLQALLLARVHSGALTVFRLGGDVGTPSALQSGRLGSRASLLRRGAARIVGPVAAGTPLEVTWNAAVGRGSSAR